MYELENLEKGTPCFCRLGSSRLSQRFYMVEVLLFFSRFLDSHRRCTSQCKIIAMRKCLIRPAVVTIQNKQAAATNTTMLLLVTLIVLTYLPHAKPDLDRLPRTPVIQTKYGAVQGRILTPEGVAKPVHVFKGIPYATPPVGSNRYD